LFRRVPPKLFLDPAATADRQIRRIIEESARHNIGDIQRNISTPSTAASAGSR
jgi:hypothetical protein